MVRLIGKDFGRLVLGLILISLISQTAQSQVKIKKQKKTEFYESITFAQPVSYVELIDPIIRLFDLQQFNNDAYLKELEKLKLLKKQGQDYWFRVPLQEDFGDSPCYMIFDSTLFWFGGFKPFAWSKDGKDKKEPEVIVWAEYVITPGVGIVLANSNILDNTGSTHIDMKGFYSNLNGAHIKFEDRKKPKKPKKRE